MSRYLPETTLIDTTDGLQFKVYANDHPDGFVIARPKYIPQDNVKPHGLKSRFLFSKAMTRFNPFANASRLKKYLAGFKKAYPHYFYWSPTHKSWFFAVPIKKIQKIHDAKAGLQELLKVNKKDLDPYLSLVHELIMFLKKSGVSVKNLGITNSTLLGNYTFGKSDIDIVVFGKKNGWKIHEFLEKNKHPLMQWKKKKEWEKYYDDHKLPGLGKKEFVFHNMRKRNEGLFGKHVFTIFCVEKKQERWTRWGTEKYQPLGVATVQGVISDDYNSIVRPASYGIKNSGVTQIVTYALPFMTQAKRGEKIEAKGLLEKVVPRRGKPYCRLVVGYPAVFPKKSIGEYLKKI